MPITSLVISTVNRDVSMMRAVRFHDYGDESVLALEDIPIPEVGEREALVRVIACGVNHIDLDLRAGISRFPLSLPHVLGREVVGEVVSLSPPLSSPSIGSLVVVSPHITCGRCSHCRSDASNLCVNRKLPGVNCAGGYAEYICAPAEALVPVPEGLSAIDAAAIPIAFGTAWDALIRRARLRLGESVLVTGAAGGVGSASVQLAVMAGANVIAAAGSDSALERLRSLGPIITVNYTHDRLDEAVLHATSGKGVSVVLDTVGGDMFSMALRCLNKGGRYAVVGAHAGECVPLDLISLFRNSQQIFGAGGESLDDLSLILELAAVNRLHPMVHAVIPLDRAAEAHRVIRQRQHFGKLILSPTL